MAARELCHWRLWSPIQELPRQATSQRRVSAAHAEQEQSEVAVHGRPPVHQEPTEPEDLARAMVVDHPAGAKEGQSSPALRLLEGSKDPASHSNQGED